MKKVTAFPKIKPHKRKPQKKKLMSMKRLETVTWTIFSQYIRLRDSIKCGSIGHDWVECYTCGKDILVKEAHASHFIPRGKHSVRFNEMNVNSCCVYCNKYLHGNLGKYAIHLEEEYGKEALSQLIMLEQVIHKFTREELESIRQNCAFKISKML